MASQDAFGQYTGDDKSDFWSNSLNTLGSLWGSYSTNQTNQNIAKANAMSVSSTVKFLGFVIIVGIIVKKLFKL